MTSIVTKKNKDCTYHGEWQTGAAHLEKLEGPIGQGVIEYDNGDRFEGDFQLPYGGIHGEAYTAKGDYRFAGGSFIKDAWLNNTYGGSGSLVGVYLVNHPDAPDTITPFEHGKRNGLEIVMADNPHALEWESDKMLQELAIESYSFETLEYDDLTQLIVTFADGTVVTERGGCLASGRYGWSVFKTGLYKSVRYAETSKPDLLKTEYYETPRTVELPDPMDKEAVVQASVQRRANHIEYGWNRKYYGELKGDQPHGHGVLVCGQARYEGEFKDGLFHGAFSYTNKESDAVLQGQWHEGCFQYPDGMDSPIKIHIDNSCTSETVIAKPGFLNIDHFSDTRIEWVEKDRIIISSGGRPKYLTPDQPYRDHEIEYGRELSDGTPLEDDKEYHLTITWVK